MPHQTQNQLSCMYANARNFKVLLKFSLVPEKREIKKTVKFQAYIKGPVKQSSVPHVIVQLYLMNISTER